MQYFFSAVHLSWYAPGMTPPAHKMVLVSQGLMAHPMVLYPERGSLKRSPFLVYEPSAVLKT